MEQGKCRLAILLAAVLLPNTADGESVERSQGQTYGWIERVALHPGDIVLKAKLDSGATTSSVHARNVSLRHKKGTDWVRFTLEDPNGEPITVDRPVSRWVNIKRHGAEPQTRPVVTVGICLDYTYRVVEVSLADRSDFNYQVLLGRNFLAGIAYIDPSQTLTAARPTCREVEPFTVSQHLPSALQSRTRSRGVS